MPNHTVAIENPIGSRAVRPLLLSMAIPAVISNLFNAVYNIVDQIFIGNVVGFLGNAATNIAYPLTTLAMAIGFMIGIGAAAGFNLNLGAKRQDVARAIDGTAVVSMVILGVLISILVSAFLRPLMLAFGATDEILPYAMDYSRIVSLGLPFLLFSTGANPLVRGDGNAKYAMASIISGAVLNVVLDYLFMFVFRWGIAGAAWATVIGQAVSAVLLLLYFPRFRNVKFEKKDFVPRWDHFKLICKLGFASFAFMASSLIVQVVLNNLLKKYGDLSIYGSGIAIAVAGIMQKINAIFVAVITGIVQGSQPIVSFNYGAKKYTRVRETVRLLLFWTTGFSVIVFLLLECFPRQIMSVFGEGSTEYFEFATLYVRAFAAALFLNGTQTSCTMFFPSIGKAWKGSVISLSKQLGILVPLLLILSSLMGLTGIVIATPVTDVLSFLIAAAFLYHEMKLMPEQDGNLP